MLYLKLLNNKYVRIITHTDLDGQSCPAIIKSYIEINNINSILDIKYVPAFKQDEFILPELDSIKDELVIITDISPEQNIVDKIDRLNNDGHNIILVDHHPDSVKLDRSWNLSQEEDNGRKISATELLEKILFNGNKKYIETFSQAVSARDTFNSKSEYWELGNQLNDLCFLFPKGSFFTQEISKRLSNLDDLITKSELDKINEIKEAHKKYCNEQAAKCQLKAKEINGKWYNYAKAEVDCNKQSSDTAKIIYESNDIDFVAIYVRESGAYALRSNNAPVLPIAEYLGGGGHEFAAGCKPEDPDFF